MRFVIYRDSTGEYRWRLVAGNGQTIADSGEGYTTAAGARHGIDLVMSRLIVIAAPSPIEVSDGERNS